MVDCLQARAARASCRFELDNFLDLDLHLNSLPSLSTTLIPYRPPLLSSPLPPALPAPFTSRSRLQLRTGLPVGDLSLSSESCPLPPRRPLRAQGRPLTPLVHRPDSLHQPSLSSFGSLDSRTSIPISFVATRPFSRPSRRRMRPETPTSSGTMRTRPPSSLRSAE